jgi:hypothetical protein
VYVAAGEDDAEENPDGKVNLTSSDLELVQEDQRQIVGIRFPRVPLERGQKLNEAFVQFTVDETNDEPTSLVIEAEASDDAPGFTSRKYDVSSRRRTKAKVSWRVEPWSNVGAAGAAQRTPNLAPLLAEIIQRPGWKTGHSIALIITGEGKRVADSFNGGHTTGNAITAPRLVWRKGGDEATSGTPAPVVADVPPVPYTVRLAFAEPKEFKPGERVFDVELQGATVLSNFDVARDAGGPRRTIVKQFHGIPVRSDLQLRFTPRLGLPILCGLEVSIEE